MSSRLKMVIGLLAALTAGWISHGPVGRGEAFIASLEAKAATALREAEMPQVQARMKRAPLRRVAVLSGSANDFQREGMGETFSKSVAYSASKIGNAVLTYLDAVMVQALRGNEAAARTLQIRRARTCPSHSQQ